jgi:dTDP-4-dehydrorhamnose reductase
MTRRLMVTGGSGFVAGSVIAQADRQWEVHALDLKDAPIRRSGLVWHAFDLLDHERLQGVFGEVRPDAVIHTAALADIDYCQEHKELAEQVNVGVTRKLVDLCRRAGTRLILLSTDTVFDGQKGYYNETDAPGPLNHYAATKVAAEGVVSATAENWVITRLSLVMGLPVLGIGNSFLARMVAAMNEGKQVGMPDEEIRSPIDVITLGRALLELAGGEYQGILHLAGNTVLNRFEMAQRIAERLGYSRDLIVVKNPSATPGRAPRPRDASLNNSKAREMLRAPMRTLDEGIDLIVSAKGGLVG